MLVIVAPVRSPRAAAVAAAAFAAAAALLSFGAIAFSGPSPSTLPAGARLGVIPLDFWHLAAALAAGVIVLAAGWRSQRGPASILIAVAPLALVFLPWLPFSVPDAFLIWTGGVLSLVWLATAIALAGFVVFGVGISRLRHQVIAPAVLSFVIFAIAAWLASPSIPGGDEPHYLVITQSLLYDHDLKIENNHQRGDYRAYFPGDLNPDSIRRGSNGAVYSIHAPGVPALVLPAFAVAGYRGVVVFLLLVSSAACALAWYLAWRVSGDAAAAWFGWAVVALSAPWLLETYTVYPDGPGAAIVLTGFWALLRAEWEKTGSRAEWEKTGSDWGQTGVRLGSDWGQTRVEPQSDPSLTPWLLHGAALALLPWMHTRFSVLAATLGGLILVRLAHVPKAMAKAIAFLLPPAISAVAWLFFFVVIYGAPDPSAPYGGRLDSSFAFLPNGLGGLLFDQGFGLLATAPVVVFAFAGFARVRRLALEWLVVALPYLLAVTTFAMWWAGMSGPARFLVPLMLPLAIPAACAWRAAASRGLRATMLAALLVSIWLSLVMAGAGGGRLGYHTRNEGGMTAAPWMDWATHVVDLAAAAPAFVPQPVQPDPGGRVSRARAAQSGFATTIVWAAALGAAAFAAAWWIDRRRLTGAAPIAVLTAASATAVMVAGTIVWKMQGGPSPGVAAQMDALRMLAGSRTATFDLTAHRRVNRAAAWSMSLEVPISLRAGRGGPRPLNRPLAVFPGVPAGSYILQVKRRGGRDGWVMAGVGNDQFSIVTQPIAAFDSGIRIDLPVDVRAINVRSDEDARDQLQAIALTPIAMAPRLSRDVARRAARYDASVFYFLDDRAFPEPSGFWVGGARDTTVAIHADRSAPVLPILVRNGAADNHVLFESGAWRGDIGLRPGEERRMEVPLDAAATALLRIRSEGGFRPSDVDGRSKDTRFLGVFVRPE